MAVDDASIAMIHILNADIYTKPVQPQTLHVSSNNTCKKVTCPNNE